jgi:hypothetical protein
MELKELEILKAAMENGSSVVYLLSCLSDSHSVLGFHMHHFLFVLNRPYGFRIKFIGQGCLDLKFIIMFIFNGAFIDKVITYCVPHSCKFIYFIDDVL